MATPRGRRDSTSNSSATITLRRPNSASSKHPRSTEPEPLEELAAELSRASSVDAEVANLLQAQTNGIRQLDARQGARLIHDQMRAHIAHVEELNHQPVRPGVRRMLAKVLADASALGGWQALDVGAHPANPGNTSSAPNPQPEKPKTPHSSPSPPPSKRTCCSISATRGPAVEMVQFARHQATGTVPGLMATWLAAAHAEMATANGNADAAHIALDQAADLLPAEPDDLLPYLVLSTTHLARWRGNCLARLGDEDAIDELTAGLAAVTGTYARAEAGVRIDLATALLVHGDHGTAEDHLPPARILVGRTGSQRQKRRLQSIYLSF